MSSIALKLTSLVVKTLSKPIANQIKSQAREHARFRRICVAFAQRLHRVDMRLRLGLLQDPAAIERQAAKEAAELQAKKRKAEIPTVKTEAQTKAEETVAEKDPSKAAEKAKAASKPRIRPLSEAKAIDTGANFISETFLFLVGGGLIVFESFRSRRRENTRREDVSGRIIELEQSERNARRALVSLEKEVIRLRREDWKEIQHSDHRILPREVWELEEEEEEQDERKTQGWLDWIKRLGSQEKEKAGGEKSQGPQSAPPKPSVEVKSPTGDHAGKASNGSSKERSSVPK
ncbi:MAG: Cell cycle serine/threonine-protein kinase cdc5/MSD2 [Chaenotheca gracillima]|nr:MAG: Cell cycle serine/threonine-protein kinase cdc5/MSD2 [Chaenotheca gracillima]